MRLALAGVREGRRNRDAAAGEDFNIVARTALSVRGYADIAAAWFGQAANLETGSWVRFRATTTRSSPNPAGATITANTASPSKRPSRSWTMHPATSRKRPCSNPSSG